MEMLEAFLRVEDGDVLLYGVLDILSLLLGMICLALQFAAARGVVLYVHGKMSSSGSEEIGILSSDSSDYPPRCRHYVQTSS